jgi:hypothetical protein
MSTTSDDLLHLKASEAAIEALRGSGFAILANSQMANELTELVKGSVKQSLAARRGSRSTGFGNLVSEAVANVDRVIGQLTPAQQAAARAGIDPANPAAVHAFLARFAPEHGGHIHLASRGDPSGARFDRIDGIAGNWSTPAGMAKMRDYAIQIGVPWAANNPDLLRLGPSALQVLADSHLRQSVYNRMTAPAEGGLTPREVVSIARWAKDNGRDANELGNAISDVNKGLNSDEKKQHNAAIMGVVQAKPPEQAEAKRKYKQTMDDLAVKHPELKPAIDKERRTFQQKTQQVHKAETNATAATEKTGATLSALNSTPPPASQGSAKPAAAKPATQPSH